LEVDNPAISIPDIGSRVVPFDIDEQSVVRAAVRRINRLDGVARSVCVDENVFSELAKPERPSRCWPVRVRVEYERASNVGPHAGVVVEPESKIEFPPAHIDDGNVKMEVAADGTAIVFEATGICGKRVAVTL
jgi:hypothetical protein